MAPPSVETPLFRGEFEQEMKHQKGIDVASFVRKALVAIDKGQPEFRVGMSNMFNILGRVAPKFALHQMAKMTAPKS